MVRTAQVGRRRDDDPNRILAKRLLQSLVTTTTTTEENNQQIIPELLTMFKQYPHLAQSYYPVSLEIWRSLTELGLLRMRIF